MSRFRQRDKIGGDAFRSRWRLAFRVDQDEAPATPRGSCVSAREHQRLDAVLREHGDCGSGGASYDRPKSTMTTSTRRSPQHTDENLNEVAGSMISSSLFLQSLAGKCLAADAFSWLDLEQFSADPSPQTTWSDFPTRTRRPGGPGQVGTPVFKRGVRPELRINQATAVVLSTRLWRPGRQRQSIHPSSFPGSARRWLARRPVSGERSFRFAPMFRRGRRHHGAGSRFRWRS